MALRLLPRDDAFAEMFAAQADALVSAASALAEVLGVDADERGEVRDRVAAHTRRSAELRHRLVDRTSESLVTPFDRSLVFALAAAVDAAAAATHASADLIVRMSVLEIPQPLTVVVWHLNRGAEMTADTVSRLRSPGKLRAYPPALAKVRADAEQTLRTCRADLLTPPTGATVDELAARLRVRELLEPLQRCLDALAEIAAVVTLVHLTES